MICAPWSNRRRAATRNRRFLWTCKSLRKLARGLCDMGHKIGRTVVGELLHELGDRLQANRKTREGGRHPDRDAQFRSINDRVKDALAAGEPAIPVDAKKKQLVGDFKNAGREAGADV